MLPLVDAVTRARIRVLPSSCPCESILIFPVRPSRVELNWNSGSLPVRLVEYNIRIAWKGGRHRTRSFYASNLRLNRWRMPRVRTCGAIQSLSAVSLSSVVSSSFFFFFFFLFFFLSWFCPALGRQTSDFGTRPQRWNPLTEHLFEHAWNESIFFRGPRESFRRPENENQPGVSRFSACTRMNVVTVIMELANWFFFFFFFYCEINRLSWQSIAINSINWEPGIDTYLD